MVTHWRELPDVVSAVEALIHAAAAGEDIRSRLRAVRRLVAERIRQEQEQKVVQYHARRTARRAA